MARADLDARWAAELLLLGASPGTGRGCIGDIFGDPERDDVLDSMLTGAIGTRPMLEVRLPGVIAPAGCVIPWTITEHLLCLDQLYWQRELVQRSSRDGAIRVDETLLGAASSELASDD